jgi:hypothetical protein
MRPSLNIAEDDTLEVAAADTIEIEKDVVSVAG